MPIDLLIYIAIAAVLVLWLRNTLGSQNGSETDRSEILNQLRERQQMEQATKGRIVDLPSSPTEKPEQALDGIGIEGGAETAGEILDFIKVDRSFNPKEFLTGACEAFPMIVESFAKGNLKTLRMLLSDGVYATFEQAIEDRKNKGETLITDVLAVKDIKIMGLKRIGSMAYIKMRFLAEETIILRDRDGNVINGHPDKIVSMNDVWTFGRDTKSPDPTWYLYETSDDVIEDFKNPMPDTVV